MSATQPYRPERVEPGATYAFILSLCSLLVPLFPAVNALALAPGALRNIKASNGLRRGKGLVMAAIAISVVTLLANVAFFIYAFSSTT